MVKVVDNRGRGYEVSMWNSLLPSPKRPPVRKIARKDRKTSNASSTSSAAEGKPKVKDVADSKAKDKGKADNKAKEKGESIARIATCTNTVVESEKRDKDTSTTAKKASSDKKKGPRTKLRKASKKLGDWSEEHDIQLLKLKDEDEKKWLDVVLLMGKPKELLIERYYELKAKPEVASSGSSEVSSSQGSANSWTEIRKAIEEDEDSWSATDPTDCITEPDFQPAVLEVGDKVLTLGETRFAVHLNNFLEEQKWLFLASKLFDKTGKRVTPESLKQGLSGD